jgi:hypothetical protein
MAGLWAEWTARHLALHSASHWDHLKAGKWATQMVAMKAGQKALHWAVLMALMKVDKKAGQKGNQMADKMAGRKARLSAGQ